MTYIKNPDGSFSSQSSSGLVPIQDPVLNQDLATGRLASVPLSAYSGPNVPAAGPAPANTTPQAPVVPAGTPGGTGGASGAIPSPYANAGNDPATLFNAGVFQLLQNAKNQTQNSNAGLGAQLDTLNRQSLNLANPLNATPYAPLFKGLNAGQTLGGMQGTEGAFAPGVTSINTQMQLNNAALQNDLALYNAAVKPQVVAPGGSLVGPSGNVIRAGHQYQPQINPNTGLLDGFDINTGTWASADTGSGGMAGSTPQVAPGSTPATSAIESIFGKSNPIGAYATDPNYVKEISGLLPTVTQAVNSLGGHTDLSGAMQQYINNNTKGKSPVTGTMVTQAAQTYGIDPMLLATVLLHESDFGTAGAAVNTMNPGNQGNTGAATKTYPSWQQGVLATASNLANRMSAAGIGAGTQLAGGTATTQPATPAAMVSPTGGQFSAEASAKISQLPPAYQNFVDAGPKGIAYINSDRVPANYMDTLKIQASRAGIPLLTSPEVENVKGIGIVYQSIQKMQALVASTLGGGLTGRLTGLTLNPFQKWAQVLQGPELAQFDQYRSQAINNLKALTAGGTTFRITQSEIDTAVANIPGIGDNIETANTDLKTLGSFMDQKLAATFPYSAGQSATGNQVAEGTTKNYNGVVYKVINGVWTPQ